jgi:hypothetical protein
MEPATTFLRMMRIHDIKDIMHVGQQPYSSLRNVIGSHNFEVLSNVIIDIRILTNYCLSSELVDLLGEYRDAEEAWTAFYHYPDTIV